MNKEIIKDELRWLLEAINEQFEAIRKYDTKIPQIEFDILMENVRKMYESMRVLERLNDVVPVDLRTGGRAEMRNEASDGTRSMAGISAKTTGTGVTIRFDKPAGPDSEKEDPPAAPVVPADLPFKPVSREIKKEAPVKRVQKPETMDLFAVEEPTFNIKLKEARNKTFEPKIPAQRIDNLKTAITINDKFMFINELFEGNLREYNETIETLNGFRTLGQAGEFLDLVKRKNFWDTGSVAFTKLKELVERRF